MLRTNLSTRPFYNERVVRVAIGVAVLLTAALTAFNAAEILSLNQRSRALAEEAEVAEGKARDLRAQALVIRQSLNKQQLEAVQEAAREANVLIDRRAFSWTDLFNRFEETLPADIRIVAVAPQVDNAGRTLVAVTVISKEPDIEPFFERLEATGAFSDMIGRNSTPEEDGTTRTVAQGYYNALGFKPAVTTAPTSDSNEVGGNATPGNATPRTAPVGNTSPRAPGPGGSQ